ncbi:uncharacterized protein LOC143281533 [Babylonia areolata]|uniref:uncharacterized protein LOC143281533 n=1 Tax=Babylonia areolata TaxID=304850 RepID=UPI003FCF360F
MQVGLPKGTFSTYKFAVRMAVTYLRKNVGKWMSTGTTYRAFYKKLSLETSKQAQELQKMGRQERMKWDKKRQEELESEPKPEPSFLDYFYNLTFVPNNSRLPMAERNDGDPVPILGHLTLKMVSQEACYWVFPIFDVFGGGQKDESPAALTDAADQPAAEVGERQPESGSSSPLSVASDPGPANSTEETGMDLGSSAQEWHSSSSKRTRKKLRRQRAKAARALSWNCLPEPEWVMGDPSAEEHKADGGDGAGEMSLSAAEILVSSGDARSASRGVCKRDLVPPEEKLGSGLVVYVLRDMQDMMYDLLVTEKDLDQKELKTLLSSMVKMVADKDELAMKMLSVILYSFEELAVAIIFRQPSQWTEDVETLFFELWLTAGPEALDFETLCGSVRLGHVDKAPRWEESLGTYKELLAALLRSGLLSLVQLKLNLMPSNRTCPPEEYIVRMFQELKEVDNNRC